MLRVHAPNPGLDDLPELREAHFRQRGEVPVLRRVESEPLRIRTGTTEVDRAPARPGRRDRGGVRGPLYRGARAPARGDLPDARLLRNPLARRPRALSAR